MTLINASNFLSVNSSEYAQVRMPRKIFKISEWQGWELENFLQMLLNLSFYSYYSSIIVTITRLEREREREREIRRKRENERKREHAFFQHKLYSIILSYAQL